MQHDPARRRLLLALPATVLPLSGCAAKAAMLCPDDPVLGDLTAPLTIDVHAHIFNGSDLQIKEFLAQTAVDEDSELKGVAQAMGTLLENRLERRARCARGNEVHRRLLQARGPCADNSGSSASLRAGIPGRLYARPARAAGGSAANPRGPESAAVLSTGPGRTGQGQVWVRRSMRCRKRSRSSSSRAVTSLRARVSAAPQGLSPVRAASLLSPARQRTGLPVHLLVGFNRKIDLLVPSMVDYDWWLAQGSPTRTPLSEQVDLMSRISVLTGGRVHGSAPFCPFRELMTARGDSPGESMNLVQRAIQSGGFIGVKLYPPMGFAPFGNSALDVWKGKPMLPAAANETGFGFRLDNAMRRLFTWCRENEVPVMAHANHSNGPNDQFKALAGSAYWQQAIDAFPGLKVSFGHFGDTNAEDHAGERAKSYLQLMTAVPGSRGEQVYADASYFAGVLLNPKKMAGSSATSTTRQSGACSSSA